MEYIVHILILISIFAILGWSLNLIVGYTGLLSVAHAAFFGIGSYASTILMLSLGVPFFLALALGVVVTMIAALLIGAVMSQFKDDYFALASFGFNTIIVAIFINWESLTRGSLGIPGIPRPELFGSAVQSNIWFFLLVFILAGLMYFLAEWIGNSSFGRVLKAIREDEEAIAVFGYKTNLYKLTVFTIGSGMAGIAGALYASYISFIDPTSFTLLESIFILAIVIIGGLANNKGVLLGTLVVILLPELLRFIGFSPHISAQLQRVIFGLLLIVVMRYRPRGIMGEYKL